MIADILENCSIYLPVHRNLEKGFRFIKDYAGNPIPPGQYDIDGMMCMPWFRHMIPRRKGKRNGKRISVT